MKLVVAYVMGRCSLSMGVIQQFGVSSAIRPTNFRELGIANDVVGHARHPSGQLIGGEEALAPIVRRDDKLHGREPVTVEHDDEIGLEIVEDLTLEVVQSGVQGALSTVVEGTTFFVGQHDVGTCASTAAPIISPMGCVLFSLDTSSRRCRNRARSRRPRADATDAGAAKRAVKSRTREQLTQIVPARTPCPIGQPWLGRW